MILKLYKEDFKKSTDWFQICEQIKVDKTSTIITLNVTNATETQEEETVLCEGCNQQVLLSEISDVMTMYICNKCESEVEE